MYYYFQEMKSGWIASPGSLVTTIPAQTGGLQVCAAVTGAPVAPQPTAAVTIAPTATAQQQPQPQIAKPDTSSKSYLLSYTHTYINKSLILCIFK